MTHKEASARISSAEMAEDAHAIGETHCPRDLVAAERVAGECDMEQARRARKGGGWNMDTGSDGAVIYDDNGTIATVPIDLSAWEANARLMASAPELLAALEEFVEDVRIAYIGTQPNEMLAHSALAHEWPDLCITYRKASAAIAKARGEK